MDKFNYSDHNYIETQPSLTGANVEQKSSQIDMYGILKLYLILYDVCSGTITDN